MKGIYVVRRRWNTFTITITENVYKNMLRFWLMACLILCSNVGIWAQSAQVINPSGGAGLNDGLKIQVNTNGALAVYRNKMAQYCCANVWPNGATGGVPLTFRFSKGNSYNASTATLTACSTTPVQQNGNTYTTSITGWVRSTISSDLFYVTINVTYTHPNNYFYVDYFVRAASNLSASGENQLLHLYLSHDAYILGKDGSRGYRSINNTGELIGNYRLTTDRGSCGGGENNPTYPSTHGFKTKNGFRSYYTGYYGSRNNLVSENKLSNTVNTTCVDDGVAVEFTMGPFTSAGQVFAKQVLHGYGNNRGEFDNTPVNDPSVSGLSSSAVMIELTSNAYSESEGNSDHTTNTVKIRVTGGRLTQDQVCNFTLHNGTAQQGSHFTYVKGVTIPAGDYSTAKEITLNNITIKGNTECNTDRTFQISIDDPGQCNDLIQKSPTNNRATITIQDDEVRPTITTNLPNLEYHYGQTVPAITFATNPTNATVNWTNSNTSIGLNASSGNGNLPSFTAKNESTATITATITATPQGACPGTPKTFTIKVHPKLKITYEYNGGTAPTTANPTTFLYDQLVTIANEPVRKGYTFKGWTCQELNITTPAKPFVIPLHTDKNLTLRADWGLDNYTIVYTLNGGVEEGGTNPTLYDVNTPSFSLKAPRKPGFTFTGWTGSNGTAPNTSVSIPQGSTGNRNYTANWTENTYPISYNYNSGNAPASPNKANYKITEVPFDINSTAVANQPTRVGYDFTGWTGPNATSAIKNVHVTNAVFLPSGDPQALSYMANWVPINYTLIYHLNGGTASNPANYTIESAELSINKPTRSGYTFTGWTGTGLSGQVMDVKIPRGSTGNREYTANWTPINYTITYRDGSTNITVPGAPTQFNDPQLPLTINNEPTKPGWTFTGWTGGVGSDGGKVITIPNNTHANQIYTAAWTPITYTITFNPNNGVNPAIQTEWTSYDMSKLPLSGVSVTPTRTGYTFNGWTGHGLTNHKAPFSIISTTNGVPGDLTYTAQWTLDTYNLNYDLGGGTVATANPATYTYTTSTITLNNPTRTGYTFAGWTGTDITGTSMSVQIPQGSVGHRSYTATWTADRYTITYDLAEGMITTPNPDEYYVTTPTITLNNPSRSGYTFAGWTGTGIAGSSTSVQIPLGSTGDRTYTATWTPITYTIKYVDDNGTTELPAGALSAGAPTQFNDTELPKAFTVTATKAGWTFEGWEQGAGAGGTPDVTIPKAAASHAHQTYKAKWTVINYNITYSLDGGTVGAPANPSTYQVTSAPITLTPPTKSGYTFAGWTGTGLTTPTLNVTIPTGSTGARSYTATWTPITYTIKYVDDNGTTPLTTVSPGAPVQFDDTQLPKTFSVTATKPGWTFVGWTGGAGASGSQSITIAKESASHTNQTYRAIWTADDYTITFNANGGTNPTIPVNLAGYKMTTLPLTANVVPTRTGYTFAGWTGHGQTNQTAPFTITSTTAGVPGNLVYNAGWNIITYNISYDLDGGMVAGNPATYQVTDNDITLINPTKSGWTFVGWTGTELASASQSVTIPQGSTGNRSYKATWTANAYTITFDPNQGVNPANIPTRWLGYNMTDLPLNNISVTPTRSGYDFTGWTGPGQTNQTAPFSITDATPTVPGNLVYVAGWNIITYNIIYTLDGGTVNPTNPTSYQVTTPAITLNNPTRTGYTFAGWTGTDLTAPSASVTIPTGSIGQRNYTATWSENGYTITYNLNNGTAPVTPNKSTFKITDVPFTINTTASANQPTRTGYDFTGWTGHDLTVADKTINVQASTFSTPGTPENLTYTAHWNPITYAIHYTLDNGTAGAGHITSYTVESPTFNLVPPTRSGWTFVGWTGSNGSVPQTTVTVPQGTTGELNYTANWSANAYTITFDANNGVNPTIPSNLAGYNMTDLPLDVDLNPTRLGYTFKGWTGHGLPGTTDPFRIENTMPGVPGNLTFTATWELNNYTLHYHLDGGIHVPGNPSSYNVTQLPVNVATEPTHLDPNTVFIGWTCREMPTVPMTLTFTIPDQTTGELNFDAHWTKSLHSLNNNHPGNINDTLFVCEGPRILYGDPQGKSWQWILPDGRTLTTKNIDAMKSGRYVCSTNYGTKIINDTLHVYFLMENNRSSIRYITTTGAKLNRAQEFVLDIPREMWPHVTSNWSVSGGGVIRKSSADSLMVTWGMMGEKSVTVDVTFTYAGIQCSKRLSTNIQIGQRSLGFFVNHRATGGQQDGSSWQDAFLTITDALAHATVGDRIWVAKGTYRPVSGRAFEILQDSIEIYGGFEGTEEYLYQRNISQHATVVKGNGASVWKIMNSTGSRIDGFVVEDGRAERGAGVLYESASGTVANSIIRDNVATKQGGGIYQPAPLHGYPASLIVNTEISGNQSSEGAGIYNDGGDLSIVNVTISGNKAKRGGGLYNKASSPVITNTIIWGNVSTEGTPETNEVVNDGGSPLYAFSIIGGSMASGKWNAALGRDSQGNMDRNPLFLRKGFEDDGVTMRRGDYKFSHSSPAIEGGYNGAVLLIKTPWDILLQHPKSSYHSGLRFDLNHKERISESRVDIGAYEFNAGDLVFRPLSRSVTLPEVPGLITEPGPGIHMVKGQDNFVFTVRPKVGYSLEYLTVTTGIPVRDKHGIIMNKNSDGSVTVTILKVWESLNVSINGVSPVSNTLMPQHKVWANRQHLYIEAQYATIMQLYTLDGKLHTQQMIPQGNTSLPLAAGFYTVVMDGRVYKVMVE
ncbi:InlB B-repeat-containing protein [Tannerella sp.]|uniref:InlB B-repeat-containing protein n=1 Tax=Tannerella sp. TaxID=2382127 RepID=UPI003FA30B5E